MASYTPARLAHSTFENSTGVDEKSSPVIFLHGASFSKENWEDIPQIVANETKRKVYALDARNHGDSDWLEYHSSDDDHKDLFHFMDSMNIFKAVLVGHSMGGKTSMGAALKKPERVEKLIIEDSSIKAASKQIMDMFLSYYETAMKLIKDVPTEMSKDDAESFLLHRIHNELPDDIKVHFKNRLSSGHNMELKRGSDGRYTFKTNMEAIIKKRKNHETHIFQPRGIYYGPACFIYGKISQFRVEEDMQNIKNFFPNAEFVGIENATHLVHADRPKEFTEALLKFLS